MEAGEVERSLNKRVRLLGFAQNRSWLARTRTYAFFFLNCTLIVNCIYFVMNSWTDMDNRFLGFKTIAFFFTFIVYWISYAYYPEELWQLVSLVSNSNYQVPYMCSTQRRDMRCTLEASNVRFSRLWWTVVAVYSLCLILGPVTMVSIKVLYFSEDLVTMLRGTTSTPYPLYYPQSITSSTWWFYTLAYVLQSVNSVCIANYSYLANVSSLNSAAIVEYEFKFLSLSLLELEQLIGKRNVHELDIELKCFVRYFVRHHYDTYRKFEVVERGTRWIAASLNATTALFICLCLYNIMEKDLMIMKMQEALYVAVWVFEIYLFNAMGEGIETEHENLRNALYECAWTDKPKWFKSSLMIAMTRCTKSIVVKPLGLFTLNLKGFSLTMNAAYSYFNLLRKFKND